jgi:hypothetical protein
MATCFAGSGDVEFEQFPKKTALIAREQTKDKKLHKKIRESWRDYTMMKIEEYNLLSYQGKNSRFLGRSNRRMVPQISGSSRKDTHGSNATYSVCMVR